MIKKAFFLNICLFCIFLVSAQESKDTVTAFSGLKYVVQKEGSGKQAYANRRVNINYIGRFMDGRVFDQSGIDGFSFVLGHGQVIKGMDEGIRMMNVGSRYVFIIPPKMAYGKKGYGDIIPPNETLIFEVSLNSVEDI